MIFPWYYCPFRQQAQRTARRPIKNHDLSGHNFEKLLVEIRGVWTIKGLGSGQRGFRRWGFNSGTTLGGKLPTAMDTNLRWQAEIRQPHQFEVKVVYLIYHYLQGLINNTRWVGNGISEPWRNPTWKWMLFGDVFSCWGCEMSWIWVAGLLAGVRLVLGESSSHLKKNASHTPFQKKNNNINGWNFIIAWSSLLK